MTVDPATSGCFCTQILPPVALPYCFISFPRRIWFLVLNFFFYYDFILSNLYTQYGSQIHNPKIKGCTLPRQSQPGAPVLSSLLNILFMCYLPLFHAWNRGGCLACFVFFRKISSVHVGNPAHHRFQISISTSACKPFSRHPGGYPEKSGRIPALRELPVC